MPLCSELTSAALFDIHELDMTAQHAPCLLLSTPQAPETLPGPPGWEATHVQGRSAAPPQAW